MSENPRGLPDGERTAPTTFSAEGLHDFRAEREAREEAERTAPRPRAHKQDVPASLAHHFPEGRAPAERTAPETPDLCATVRGPFWCALPQGHEGRHQDESGVHWRNATPAQRLAHGVSAALSDNAVVGQHRLALEALLSDFDNGPARAPEEAAVPTTTQEQLHQEKTMNGQTQEPEPSRDALLPWTISGETFEAIIALRTMERVFWVLERGELLGFDWPRIGVDGARADRAFARFRAIRDDLVRLRELDAKA